MSPHFPGSSRRPPELEVSQGDHLRAEMPFGVAATVRRLCLGLDPPHPLRSARRQPSPGAAASSPGRPALLPACFPFLPPSPLLLTTPLTLSSGPVLEKPPSPCGPRLSQAGSPPLHGQGDQVPRLRGVETGPRMRIWREPNACSEVCSASRKLCKTTASFPEI